MEPLRESRVHLKLLRDFERRLTAEPNPNPKALAAVRRLIIEAESALKGADTDRSTPAAQLGDRPGDRDEDQRGTDEKRDGLD